MVSDWDFLDSQGLGSGRKMDMDGSPGASGRRGCSVPTTSLPCPSAHPVPCGMRCPAGGGSAPCWCSPNQRKGEIPRFGLAHLPAWQSWGTGCWSAPRGGWGYRHGKWSFGYFCYIPYSSCYLDEGAGSFQGQSSQNPAGDHESTTGCLLANCNFWVLMPNSVLAFGGAGQKFLI